MMNAAREPACISVVFNDDQADVAALAASAMKTARAAQERWARAPLYQRIKFIRELRSLIAENAHQLAESSALPRSRPVLESITSEVLPLAEQTRGDAEPLRVAGLVVDENLIDLPDLVAVLVEDGSAFPALQLCYVGHVSPLGGEWMYAAARENEPVTGSCGKREWLEEPQIRQWASWLGPP